MSVSAYMLIVLSLAGGSLCRAFLGPLPFWPIFLFIELFKVASTFFGGLLNMSAFIQMSIILEIREVVRNIWSSIHQLMKILVHANQGIFHNGNFGEQVPPPWADLISYSEMLF